MAFLTYQDINTRQYRLDEGTILKTASEKTVSKKVFLSHSSADKEHLPGVINFLEEFAGRGSVYIDKADSELPSETSPATGVKLRQRIQTCPRFILLVSPKSKSSRWVPWELGLADGYISPKHIALLPIHRQYDDEQWAKAEYLGIYQRILHGGWTDGTSGWMVRHWDSSSATPLVDWVRAPV